MTLDRKEVWGVRGRKPNQGKYFRDLLAAPRVTEQQQRRSVVAVAVVAAVGTVDTWRWMPAAADALSLRPRLLHMPFSHLEVPSYVLEVILISSQSLALSTREVDFSPLRCVQDLQSYVASLIVIIHRRQSCW
jgi:hypothetical protein